MDETFTIAPPFCFIIGRDTARISMKAPFRLVSRVLSQSSSLKRISRPSMATPALFTSTSRRPNSLTTPSMAALQASESATSKRIALALPPASTMAFTVSAAAASLPA